MYNDGEDRTFTPGTFSITDSRVAYATTSYNTGWMNGDIKGAFLSDTDTTDATYSTVADDWATASSWSKQSNITITSTGSGTSGTLSLSGANSGSNVSFFTGISVEANTDYVVTVTFGNYSANAFWINTTAYSGSGILLDIGSQSGNSRGGYFNSGSNTTLYIQGYQVSSSATTITSLVIQKVSEIDRSVNNNPLQVFGTVTKSAVATGADLVAYSGWSNTNHLRQPYNSDMNFGTDDFCVMGWINTSSLPGTTSVIVAQHNGVDNTGNRWSFYILSSGLLGFYQQNGSDDTNTVNGPAITSGTWQHVVVVRRGSINRVVFYLNGESLERTATSRDVTNTGNIITVGVDHSFGSAATNTSISLLRITKSVPSAEQVKKMYEDEKVLFQENAKATLYGSSDAVTALGYDDDEETLYVGTSSGRSDFRGLRRINNTTTAVTTAISASNGLVAEQ